MPKYDVLVGCNYPPEDTRAEPGDVIDVPEGIGKLLTEAGATRPQKAPTGDGKKKSTNGTTKGSPKASTGKEG